MGVWDGESWERRLTWRRRFFNWEKELADIELYINKNLQPRVQYSLVWAGGNTFSAKSFIEKAKTFVFQRSLPRI